MQRFLLVILLAVLATTGVCFARGTTRHTTGTRHTTSAAAQRHTGTSHTHSVKRTHHRRSHASHATRASHAAVHHVRPVSHL